MDSYTLNVLGIDIAFKADANIEDLEKAKLLIESRAEQLKQQAKHITKEKEILFLALGLSYDLIQANGQLHSIQNRLEDMLLKVEDARSAVSQSTESE